MSRKEKNTMFGKKRSKLSVLPVVFSSILAAGTIAGSAVSIAHVSRNHQESSEFKKSYNARINVNPVAYEENKIDKSIAEANLKESAARLSAWLKYNGAESYDVSYELTEPTTAAGTYEESGWLSAHFTVNKIVKKHITSEDDEKIDNDPYLSYFDAKGFNTNNRSLVYRWYNPSKGSLEGPYYTVLDFCDIFDMPTNLSAKDNNTKSLIDKDGKSGILYKIKTNDKLNAIYKDLKQAYKDTQEDPKTNEKKVLDQYQKPEIYIINNMEQMFNEVNYHFLNYCASLSSQQTDIDYKNIYDGTDYQKFAKLIVENDKAHKPRTGSTPHYKLESAIKGTFGTVEDSILNGEVLYYLDYSKYGTVEYSFLNKYVEKIFTFESKDYEKFFPDKITDTYHNDEASTKDEPNLQYAWYPTTSTTEADKILSQQVEKNLKCKVVNIKATSGSTPLANLDNYFKKAISSRQVPPKFVETIFGSNIIGALSLGFLLFLIALLIILAVLYRTTGVMAWICMMFMLSMTGLIATLGSSIITMSLLFGLFVMSLVGFIAAIAICGRIKRRICSNEDTSVAVIKGLKKSLWPLVDISFITVLFGICFTYIAPMNLNPLGVALIAGGFMTFISMYLLNGLLMLLFFNNGLTMNKFKFLGRPNNKANEALAQSNSYVPSSLDATKLEFAFYDRFSTTKFGLINWKTLITVVVIGVLLIVGIIVFSIMGLAKNSLFHSSMCIVINSTTSPLEKLSELGFKYSTYSNIGNYWYFYCDVPSQTIMESISSAFTNAQFGYIIGNTNKDILNYAMISMLVASICASVYTGIRSNWSAFVPMLAGSILVPLLILGIGSIVQIKFDQDVVLGFALIVVVNTLMSNTLIASVNESWFRKESYNPEELKFIVTASLKNSLSYIIYIVAAYALFILFFGICSPNGLTSIVWLMVIGVLCTSLVTPMLVGYILYYFLLIRSKVLIKRANRLANKVVVNMDEIDEQSIEGINKFTKSRAYSKKPVGETK